MPGRAPEEEVTPSDLPLLHRVLNDASRGGADLQQGRSDLERRKNEELLDRERLLPLVEDGDGQTRRLIAYLTGPGLGHIDLSDAAPIGSMLDAVGTCDNLDLMLNSPGGSGEMAEKIVEMCRDHCRKEFRVIVPNYAKSAGTLISLGADRVVMGYLSELGPIDPQVLLDISNVQTAISAQSIIQAFETTQAQISALVAEDKPTQGYLQSLASSTMEPGFVEHCRRGVEFSRDIAKKFLPMYQLKAKYKDQTGYGKRKLEELATEVADNLLSQDARFSHGRLIGAEEARDDVGLNVEQLERNDPRWEAYWELYMRAEVFMQTLQSSETTVTKLFFDRDSVLPVWAPL